MKTAAALALALLSAVSAAPAPAPAPVVTRQTSTEFDVAGFRAGCTPHSALCFFDLSVVVAPNTPAVACSATAYSYQSLPSLASTACADPSVSFSYTIAADGTGADLEIDWVYDTGRTLTGKHFIPADQIIWTNTQVPTGTVQVYDGPTDFVVGDLTVSAVL